MRYIVILLLFCSCSSTFIVNGVAVKQKVKPVSNNEKGIYIAAFLVGCSVTRLFVIP